MRKVVVFSFAAAILFSGCSTLSQSDVFDSMNLMTSSKGSGELTWIKSAKEEEAVRSEVERLLKEPLSEENAVRITLINNRALQQTYEQIGISQSDLVQAGLMSNPLLGYSIGRGGGIRQSGVTLELAFLDLLWIPLRRELGGLALEETKLSVGDAVLQTLRDAKKRYIDARVAEESVRLNDDVLKSHEVSLQLATRQYTAGNLSKRDVLKIQDEYAHARLESIRLNRESAIAREALNKLLGIYGEQTYYTLSKEPITLGNQPRENGALERIALEHRLDFASAQKRVEYAAKEAGYSEKTALLDEVSVELGSEKSTGESRINTIGVKIPIPIFDMGQGRLSRTQSLYNQSVQNLVSLAVNIRSEVREAYATARYNYEMASEYQDSIAINRDILEQTQLYYNGMLDGIYELLFDQRRYRDTKIESLKAIGEYQKAQADLIYTLGGENNATQR
ncbi:TolC family protein [Sulfuricurvum sp.]|uniref:TolC family protein n=1 Tax=Sulfuricurvum sp. TaxID=2025608 RepID=UPI002E3037D8|nr:TolC family protein [Sulfuricurvum sp.]HEX5330129.1 TolC family protein [Sulfuricurvum sp.]